MAAGGGLKYLAAEGSLSHMIGRSVDADEELTAGMRELLDRIAPVEGTLPKLFVVPGVFTDGESAILRAIQQEQALGFGGDRR